MSQRPSGFPLGLDELTTSPSWQDTSPLSQGLLLAGNNTPAYAGHGTLTCAQEGQEERTVAAPRNQNEGPAKGRHNEPWQDELEKATKDAWPGHQWVTGFFFSPKGGC